MEDIIPIFGITIPFAALVAIVLGPSLIRDREKARMQETLRKAIDAGQSLPPEVIEAMARAADVLPTRTKDIRRSVLLLALAGSLTVIGFLANYYSSGDGNGAAVVWGIATIPGFIGVAYMLLGLMAKPVPVAQD
ncbi:MAG: hypothetical protein K1X35_00460 [Caulobacteraceae bacterium]|nr:hypothetical protein [Caulobacteraceae bacterium]